ncbi:MAG: ABC transporter ATP-binding protein, partial [Chlorobiales bacterium]|nr:ABC transporter ATP-binding protein [Chlorobiales bacterium]
IMDEPTNHLDMRSKEMLIDALENYDGTLMLVSHDRYFLDSLVNKVIEIKNGSLRVYLGSYGEYLEKTEKALAEEQKKIAVMQKKDTGKETAPSVGKGTTSPGSHNRQKAEKLEKRILNLEKQKQEYEARMGAPDFYSLPEEETRKTVERYHELCVEINRLYAEWESALS